MTRYWRLDAAKMCRSVGNFCGDDVMISQQVREWCRGFENGRTDVRRYDRTRLLNVSGTGLNAGRMNGGTDFF